MADGAELRALLQRIDGAGYGAYKRLQGTQWSLGGLRLSFDHIQGDPFASPSRLRLRMPHGVSPELLGDEDGVLAVEDWFLRRFGREFAAGTGSTLSRQRGHRGADRSRGRSGSGRSGELSCYRPGPEICARSGLRVVGAELELRFRMGLPAQGRRVLGRAAWELVHGALREACGRVVPTPELERQVASVRRQRALRRGLGDLGLVGFVADGSVLPRVSGVDPRPLEGAIPFTSPESLRVTLQTPSGPVTGLGIPRGVTVIVGGGFHGKSTLLGALARGHLDHVPGDGREGVVTLADTVKLRAEDGRSVQAVDISSLLRELPGGRGTRPFTTLDASGSTSQAAALIEAWEAGGRCVLLDEDTCATNLMVRDARIRALVPREREPITPLVERIRGFERALGLSWILVVGGVGDYLGVADTVLSMEDFVARDRGPEARALDIQVPEAEGFERPLTRVLDPRSLAPGKIKARDERRVLYGGSELELSGVEQILDPAHAWSIARALALLNSRLDGPIGVGEALDALEGWLDTEGLECLSPFDDPDGGLIRPRRHEIAAALNRLRGLQVESG